VGNGGVKWKLTRWPRKFEADLMNSVIVDIKPEAYALAAKSWNNYN
jgi:hypothetical protein